MKVPFFDYAKSYLNERDDLLKIIDDVCSRGAFIMQKDLEIFEKSLASFVNSNYAVGVANATDGLEIACLALDLSEGDEVICSSHTMLATAAAIKLSGGKPVPVDIGNDNLIDPDAIEEAITPRTVGLMPTQLNGRTCDMDRILKIATKYKLFIIEDAAQSLGSKYKGKNAGTFGDVSAISFYPAKVLGCLGDGGALLTNDAKIYDKVFQLHDHGRDKYGVVKSWGRNSRLDNIQAAVLNFRLQNYQKVINRRRQVAAIYDFNLNDLKELKLPPPPNEGDHFDVYQNYEIEAERRDELKMFLYEKGIGTIIQWGGKGIHQWEVLNIDKICLPKTEHFFDSCIMLPMNTLITDDDVKFICDQIKSFYHKF